jgi:uncharacterized protein YggE
MNEIFTKPVRIIVSCLLVVLALFLAVSAVSVVMSWSGENPATDTKAQISVDGTGDAFAIPDTATFSFSAVGDGATTKAAQDAATTEANKALAFLKTSSIPDTDIQTTDYSIVPQYEYSDTETNCPFNGCAPQKQTLTGYEATETFTVKVEDASNAGTILGGIGSTGVQDVSGLSFTVADPSAVERSARESAIADAKTKAQQLAQDLGVKLVRIVDYQESNGGVPPVEYAAGAMNAAATPASPVPEVSAGEDKVTSNVTITYEVK